MGDVQFPARTEKEEELAYLLRQQAMLYAGAGRGSLPVETLAALLESIRFTLTLGGEEGDIRTRHHRGQTALRRETERGRMLWQAAWCGAPLEESGALAETLEDLRSFHRRYDRRFFAHEVPGTIDYPLCQSVPETLRGILYVNEYLRRLAAEGLFLARFDRERLRLLWQRSLPGWRTMPLNLFEPAAANALGRTLLGLEPVTLTVTAAERQALEGLFGGLTAAERARVMAEGAEVLCQRLELPGLSGYMTAFAQGLLPRIRVALAGEGLGEVFVSFPEP